MIANRRFYRRENLRRTLRKIAITGLHKKDFYKALNGKEEAVAE